MTNLPLAGCRILEFGGYISGPYATSLLCALGAEVVKVERPVYGDDFRRHLNDKSPYFMQYNAGKRSLSVDLKQERGVRLVRDLIPHFDVVLENMRVGKLDAVGLGREVCTELNPTLVFVSVTGFGSGGPLVDRPAYDTIGQAFGGIYSILGEAGSPQLSGAIFADIVTGLSAAAGVMAGLLGRAASGGAQAVDTSIMEAVSAVTVDSISQYYDTRVDPVRTSRHPQAQNFAVETGDGEFLAVHLSSSQKFWLSLLAAMGRGDLADDPRFLGYHDRVRHYADLAPIILQEFRTRPVGEWEKALNEFDVPYAPILSLSGYLEHPQTEWLGVLEPERDGLALVRPPWRFDGERPRRTKPAPRVGQDSRAVAEEIYSDAVVDQLISDGVLFIDPATTGAPA